MANQPDREDVTGAGQRYEQLGFTFCRLGSIALIALAPAYTLLLAAAFTIYFYVRAIRAGVRRSDCILRHPVLIIAFWLVVAAIDLTWLLTRGGPGSHP